MSELSKRKQIIYRANHRGIKEMDIVIGGYANAFVMAMDDESLASFQTIMDESDRDLFSWFTGELELPDHIDRSLFEVILEYSQKAALKQQCRTD